MINGKGAGKKTGYTEHTTQLVFFYGSEYDGDKKEGGPWRLKCIAPNGDVDGEREITHFPTGAVATFAGCQSLFAPDDKKQSLVKECTALNTPYIKDDGTVVQVWAVKKDDEFAKLWQTSEGQDAAAFRKGEVFEEKKINQFKAVLEGMFSAKDVQDIGIMYCKKQEQKKSETDIVLVGKGKDLIARLKNDKHKDMPGSEIMKALGIVVVNDVPKAKGEKCVFYACGKKTVPHRNREVDFRHKVSIEQDKQYVIHRTTGWIKVATATPQGDGHWEKQGEEFHLHNASLSGDLSKIPTEAENKEIDAKMPATNEGKAA